MEKIIYKMNITFVVLNLVPTASIFNVREGEYIPLSYNEVERGINEIFNNVPYAYSVFLRFFRPMGIQVGEEIQISRDEWKNHNPLWKSVLRGILEEKSPQDRLKKDFLRYIWRQIQIVENAFSSSLSCYKQEREEEEISYEQYEMLCDSALAGLHREYRYLWEWCSRRGLAEGEFSPMFPKDF